MSTKITEEIKSSPAFLFGKVKGLNNREAFRFATLFNNDVDFVKATTSASSMYSYICFCKEPKIDKDRFFKETSPGLFITDRSKLVMAYEKERKAYLKVKELRNKKPDEVNELMKGVSPIDGVSTGGLTYRLHVLQHILRYVTA